MGKYLESFRKRLEESIKSKRVTIDELHEKTGISSGMLYRYFGKQKAEPGLRSVELIAEALGCTPIDLIDPDPENIRAIDPLIERLSDPVIREVILNFSTLDEVQREGFRRQIKLVADATAKQASMKDKKVR